MTFEEMKKLTPDKQKELFDRLSVVRHKGKTTNYSSQYGVGAFKLSKELKVDEKEAKKLLEAYWGINWAIKEVALGQRVKRVKENTWLYNPISKMWYSLRNDKDRYSTLVQGTGVYCFDSWVSEIRRVRPQLTAQFHDEVVLEIKLGSRDKCRQLLADAIERTNNKLKLNVQLGIDVQFGHSYSDIH